MGRTRPCREAAVDLIEEVAMSTQAEPTADTFNPWSVVNLVFHHLVGAGLHPTLGANGDPGAPAAELLRALGIEPAAEGDRQVSQNVRKQLAELREAMFESGPADSNTAASM
jgi:hypothetical protein